MISNLTVIVRDAYIVQEITNMRLPEYFYDKRNIDNKACIAWRLERRDGHSLSDIPLHHHKHGHKSYHNCSLFFHHTQSSSKTLTWGESREGRSVMSKCMLVKQIAVEDERIMIMEFHCTIFVEFFSGDKSDSREITHLIRQWILPPEYKAFGVSSLLSQVTEVLTDESWIDNINRQEDVSRLFRSREYIDSLIWSFQRTEQTELVQPKQALLLLPLNSCFTFLHHLLDVCHSLTDTLNPISLG